MIDVSVIVPVYNVQAYLAEALNSILTKDNQNIEVICVDDGSTDSSSTILDEYAARDGRIKVIHKVNEGYGKAMNLGIDSASGRYIAILEPDDYIVGNMYRDLLAIADAYDLDFVKSNYYCVTWADQQVQEWPEKVIKQHDELFEHVLTENEIPDLFYGAIAHWTGLYKKEFLNLHDIRFSETPGASYQDQGFWFQTIVFAKKVYLSNNSYYRYRQDNPNSSMNNIKKLYLISDEFDILLETLKKKDMLMSYLPYYMKCRLSSHKYTIGRLSYDLKLNFLTRMAEDFNRFQDMGLLDESRIYEDDRIYLHEIMSNPKEVYERLSKTPDAIHERIKGFEAFYIYGAGVRAKRIIDNLRSDDKERLKGIIVTSIDENLRNVMGYKVEELRKLVIGEDEAVIVGVTAKYREEIVKQLLASGVTNILEIPRDLC